MADLTASAISLSYLILSYLIFRTRRDGDGDVVDVGLNAIEIRTQGGQAVRMVCARSLVGFKSQRAVELKGPDRDSSLGRWRHDPADRENSNRLLLFWTPTCESRSSSERFSRCHLRRQVR